MAPRRGTVAEHREAGLPGRVAVPRWLPGAARVAGRVEVRGRRLPDCRGEPGRRRELFRRRTCRGASWASTCGDRPGRRRGGRCRAGRGASWASTCGDHLVLVRLPQGRTCRGASWASTWAARWHAGPSLRKGRRLRRVLGLDVGGSLARGECRRLPFRSIRRPGPRRGRLVGTRGAGDVRPGAAAGVLGIDVGGSLARCAARCRPRRSRCVLGIDVGGSLALAGALPPPYPVAARRGASTGIILSTLAAGALPPPYPVAARRSGRNDPMPF